MVKCTRTVSKAEGVIYRLCSNSLGESFTQIASIKIYILIKKTMEKIVKYMHTCDFVVVVAVFLQN